MSYLTASDLQDESAWWFTNWQPRLDATSFVTFLGRICTRVGNHIQFRVGSTAYNTADTVKQAILLEAELCLAQYYLCLAAAAIADTSEDPTQNPVAGHTATQRLRDTGEAYKGRCEELLSWFGTTRWDGTGGRPRAATGESGEELIPQFTQDVDWARPE